MNGISSFVMRFGAFCASFSAQFLAFKCLIMWNDFVKNLQFISSLGINNFPKNNNSLAIPCPTTFLIRCVPPPPMTPKLISEKQIELVGKQSGNHDKANSKPPPLATPLIAAITGL